MDYTSAASLYSELESDRNSYLQRARDCAKLTIPMLFPDEGTTAATKFAYPFQGLGARGVNHLASSLLMSLLPPNQPFFRLALDEEAVRQLQGDMAEFKTQIDQTLSSIERSVVQEIETMAIRPVVHAALKQLLVAGNCLIFVDDRKMRSFRLDQYVVKRDPAGNILHIVVCESISPSALPDEAKDVIARKEPKAAHDDSLELYTCIHRKPGGKFEVYQEIEGVVLEDTRGTYAEDSMPWMALRMNRIDGESYGRSYVEEYLGDLKSLEGLTQAIVEGSAAMAKVLFLVNPNGLTRPDVLARSPNGAIREGMATDVTVVQVQKQADLSVAFQTVGAIRERLNYAFLLAESTIRDAERVTAEEVRLTTAAVERQLGGIYSVLSQEFQLPLVNRLLDVMGKAKRLPKVPKQYVKPLIVTGVDALGRGNDLQKLDAFLVGIQQTLGPEAVGRFVNVSEYMARRAAALGIDPKGLVRTEEDIADEAQQAQAMQMAEKLGGPTINAVSKGITEGSLDPSQLANAASMMTQAQQ